MADGTIIIDAKLNSKGIEEGLQNASDSATKAGSQISSAMETIGKVAAVAAATLGAAFVAAASQAVKMGSDFSAAMSEVQAISGATGADLEAITAKAKEMGATTKFSATESAEALKYMAMAGWDAEQMIDGLPGIMNLAAASGESLASVSDIVTDALTAMGLQASDAGHFADVLAKAASSSNTNVGMMGQTFKYAAPLAGALGYSIEDLSVMIGLMANAGIKGEQAGTALRSLLTRLAKPTKESADAMKRLGLEITDANGKMKPLNTIVKDLRTGFAGLTQAEQANVAAALAGQEAMSGLLAVVNASDDDFEKLTASIEDANGAAEEMARIMNDNLKGDMVILGSALEGLGIQIFEAFDAPLRQAAQSATEAVDIISKAFDTPEMQAALQTIADGVGELIQSIATFAADAIPGLVSGIANAINTFDEWGAKVGALAAGFVSFKAVSGVVGIINGLTRASSAAAAATTAMNVAISATPWALAVAGIAALVVLLVNSAKKTGGLAEDMQALKDEGDRLAESYEKTSRSIATSAQEHDEQSRAMADERQRVQKLVAEISALSSETDLTTVQQLRLKEAVAELNELMPGLTLEYNEQAQAISLAREELEALAKAELARARIGQETDYQAQLLADYNELLANRSEEEDHLNELLEARARKQADLSSFEAAGVNNKSARDLADDIKLLNGQIDASQGRLDGYTAAMAALGDAALESRDVILQSNDEATESEKVVTAAMEDRAKAAKNVSDQFDPLIAKTAEVIAATDELIEGIETETEKYAEAQAEIDKQANLTDKLVGSLSNLSSETERTADQQAQMVSTVEALNAMYPGLNLEIDQQTGLLNRSIAEIFAFTSAEDARQRVALGGEQVTTVLQQQQDATQGLNTAEAELANVQDNLASVQGLLTMVRADGVEKTAEILAITEDLEIREASLLAQEQALTRQVEYLTVKNGELGESFASAARDTGEASDKMVKSEQALAEIQRLQAEAVENLAKAYAPLKAETEALIDANTKFVQSVKDEEAAFAANLQAIDTEAEGLSRLAQKTEDASTSTEEMSSIVEVLNGRFPALNLEIDKQTGKLNKSGVEIQRWIAAWAASEKAERALSRLNDLVGDEVEAENALKVVGEQLNEVQERKVELMEQLSELTPEQTTEAAELSVQIADLTDKETALVGVQGDLITSQQELAASSQATAEIRTQSAQQSSDAELKGVVISQEALDKQKKLDEERAKAAEEADKKIAESRERMISEIQKSYERYKDMAQDFTTKIDTNSKVTMKSAEEVLKHNIDVMRQYTEDMDALSKREGISDGLLQHMKEAGPELSDLVAQMVNASDEELTRFSGLFEEAGATAADAIKSELSGAGQGIVDEVLEGLKNSTELSAAMETWIGEAMAAANTSVTDNDFSQAGTQIDTDAAAGVTKSTKLFDAVQTLVRDAKQAAMTEVTAMDYPEVGRQIDTDTATGVTNDSNRVEEAVRQVVQNAAYAALNAAHSAGFDNIGMAMAQGMASGLYAGQSMVESAARSVAMAAYSAARAALDIRSPSRKFGYLAEMSTAGYVNELQAGEGAVAMAAAHVMDAAYAAADRRGNTLSVGLTGTAATVAATQATGDTYHIERVDIHADSLEDPESVHAALQDVSDDVALRKRYKGVF